MFLPQKRETSQGTHRSIGPWVVTLFWLTSSVATQNQLYIGSSSDSQMECLISLPKQKFGDGLINLTSFFFVIRTNPNVAADKHHFRNILTDKWFP